MELLVRFACGHAQAAGDTGVPVCTVCGEHRISRVMQANGQPVPAPKFRGTVLGPNAVKE